MAEPSEKVTASYDMSEDVMGLADFINQQLDANKEDDLFVVYVELEDGTPCKKAEWVCNTLSDGSKTYNLRMTFEDD